IKPTNLSVDQKKELAIAFVKKQIGTFPVPGLGLSVVYKNKPIISQGFGTTKYGDATAAVAPNTLFQIGSYSKTFIALAIGKLVDEKKLDWLDPVKQHLPWFALADEYAEKYTTIGDLLSMNSVFGDHQGDVVWATGVYPTEKGFVQALANFDTTRPLRPGYAYSNLNFEILGQIVQSKTNQSWSEYLASTFWTPLGMTNTVGRPSDARSPERISSGHFFCDTKVIGPFDLLKDSIVTLIPRNDYLAAGSILSTTDDLTKFSQFLLAKGTSSPSIFSSPAIVSAMMTGHTVGSVIPTEYFPFFGLSYTSDGDAVTAGYGFDIVGDVLFGHHYVNKGGDTFAFKTRNGFVPSQGLGVVLLSNAQRSGGHQGNGVRLDLMTSYIAGLFLDIPIDVLDNQFNRALATLDAIPPVPCDDHFFNGKPWDTPGLAIPDATKQVLVGTYAANISTDYYGDIEVFEDGDDLKLQLGIYAERLIATADPSIFIWATDFNAQTKKIAFTGLNTSTTPAFLFADVNFVKCS
ncbi:hypothetical protein As57867_001462, partial [Aphanomyces stellatus]